MAQDGQCFSVLLAGDLCQVEKAPPADVNASMPRLLLMQPYGALNAEAATLQATRLRKRERERESDLNEIKGKLDP